jgi:hypothetical protein
VSPGGGRAHRGPRRRGPRPADRHSGPARIRCRRRRDRAGLRGLHVLVRHHARQPLVPEPHRREQDLPAEPVERAVEGVLGEGARPRTLSYAEKLFAFLPWPGYIAVDRGSAFARASARTRFGPIDVFVLRRDASGLVWRPLRFPGELRFQPRQFDPGSFVLVDDLPENTVIAIRRR